MAVALFTRAWIEIAVIPQAFRPRSVALFTRAWIEIAVIPQAFRPRSVALFTRAWIEMTTVKLDRYRDISRPLHEGVD